MSGLTVIVIGRGMDKIARRGLSQVFITRYHRRIDFEVNHCFYNIIVGKFIRVLVMARLDHARPA